MLLNVLDRTDSLIIFLDIFCITILACTPLGQASALGASWMKLYYYRSDGGNFGDDINPWFWDQIFPDFFDSDEAELLFGIGTLLNHRAPSNGRKIVCGSGFGYGQKPHIDESWEFICVRGPGTAKALNLPLELAITDPAVLLPELFAPSQRKVHDVSFMPHEDSHRTGDWQSVCERAGLHYISPADDFRQIITSIAGSACLITEAMHGAIAADAYRTPWIAVQSSPAFLEFKWRDWGHSLNLDLGFNYIPPVFNGDLGLPVITGIKNKIKRKLHSLRIGSDRWSPPPNARSSVKVMDSAVRALVHVARTVQPVLSDELVLRNRQNRLKNTFEIFAEKHARKVAASK